MAAALEVEAVRLISGCPSSGKRHWGALTGVMIVSMEIGRKGCDTKISRRRQLMACGAEEE